MTFDPNIPQPLTPLDAVQIRNQLNALKELIDAGVPGPAGPPGVGIASVQDAGDGRVLLVMTDGSSTGPWEVVSGPPGPQGPAGNDGRGVSDVVDNQNGSFSLTYTDGSYSGAIPLPPGPPGEVTNQQLSEALSGVVAGSSASTNGVELLDITVSDPPTQEQLQAVINKVNEMLTTQRR
jgi:hypothetical protein